MLAARLLSSARNTTVFSLVVALLATASAGFAFEIQEPTSAGLIAKTVKSLETKSDPKKVAAAVGASPSQSKMAVAKLPIIFERNVGQTDRAFKFIFRSPEYNVFLGPDKVTFGFSSSASKGGTSTSLGFVGANPRPKMTGEKALKTTINYFKGNDTSKWLRKVPGFGKIRYHDIYPGIDLVFYSSKSGQLEYDFVVDPGADPRQIAMRLAGSGKFNIASNGDAVISAGSAQIRQHKPRVFQVVGARKQAIPASFALNKRTLGFRLGRYDARLPLIIDPVVTFASYVPGSGTDGEEGPAGQFGPRNLELGGFGGDAQIRGQHFRVAVHPGSGDIYVTGPIPAPSAPSASRCPQTQCGALGGQSDVFIAKLDSSGSSLSYLAYLGGLEQYPSFPGYAPRDEAQGIAVDPSGAVHVAGFTTSFDFPTTDTAYQRQPGCPPGATCGTLVGGDIFVSKLSPSGSDLQYSSLLGGRGHEAALDLEIDDSGKIYLAGRSQSIFGAAMFPTTSNAFSSQGPSPYGPIVSVLDPSRTGADQLIYSSWLTIDGPTAGQQSDALGIAVGKDEKGGGPYAYVTGQTYFNFSHLYPTTPGAYQPVMPGGNRGAFLAKIDPLAVSGPSSLMYSTFLGSLIVDPNQTHVFGLDVAVDPAGAAYVVGSTNAQDFPPRSRHPRQPDPAGGGPAGRRDAFVVKIKPEGRGPLDLVYGTYLGGPGEDVAHGITFDSAGNAIITGFTANQFLTPGSPLAPGESIKPRGQGMDAWVTKLNPTGEKVLWWTYLGGPTNDWGHSVAVDKDDVVYVAGTTAKPGPAGGFPTSPGSVQAAYPDDKNLAAFVAKIAPDRPTITRVDPARGSAAGGYQVAIHGTEMSNVKAVNVGAEVLEASKITVRSDQELAITMPPHDSGTVDITVTTPGGTSEPTPGSRFTYLPEITRILPDSGPMSGGTAAVLEGYGLAKTTDVRFGGTAGPTGAASSNRLSTTSPPHPIAERVPVALTVTTLAGEKLESVGQVWFTYGATSLAPGGGGGDESGKNDAGGGTPNNSGGQNTGGLGAPSGPGGPAQTAPVPVSQAAPGQAPGPQATSAQAPVGQTAAGHTPVSLSVVQTAPSGAPGTGFMVNAEDHPHVGTQFAMVARDTEGAAVALMLAGLFAMGTLMGGFVLAARSYKGQPWAGSGRDSIEPAPCIGWGYR